MPFRATAEAARGFQVLTYSYVNTGANTLVAVAKENLHVSPVYFTCSLFITKTKKEEKTQMNLNVFRVCLFELQFQWYADFPAFTSFKLSFKSKKKLFFLNSTFSCEELTIIY